MSAIEALAWEPLFVLRLDVDYAAAQSIGGDDRLGIFPVRGGTFEGAKLRGRVLPDGADWVTWRPDGTMNIDVRTSLETEDGARIAMHYTGIAVPTSPAAVERFRRREPGPYEDLYLHTTPRFVTDHPDYAWLNHVIAVTNGMRSPDGPVYHVFAIR
ncbi:DUF3237 domain-containing protein [Sphingomonas colocasiae]|uniref:UPF0311 protein K7G82_10015 n=1 Tax=Sphingomonas colocasiae TaxID=1848973 RepID=A0ABS7PRJ6_9SPHN|nr:DUF3237 domain-containing protein [Sphingomonas colocasiae]MBY8822629.1 DUF3237 domain-containing protein [Sphingomonas colocasiae]